MRQPWNTVLATTRVAAPAVTSGRRPWGAPWGTPRARVGLGLHSINDVEEEAASLHTEMMQFGQELRDQLFVPNDARDVPLPGAPPEKIDLYHRVWRPLMAEWLKFHEDHAHSFWQNLPFSGAWDRIQDFRRRLIAVRSAAKEQQFRLVTPDPIPPKPDPDLTKTIEGAVKVAAYAAVGIGGILLLKILSKGGSAEAR